MTLLPSSLGGGWIQIELGERRVLHEGRLRWLRALAWMIPLFFLVPAAFLLAYGSGTATVEAP